MQSYSADNKKNYKNYGGSVATILWSQTHKRRLRSEKPYIMLLKRSHAEECFAVCLGPAGFSEMVDAIHVSILQWLQDSSIKLYV